MNNFLNLNFKSGIVMRDGNSHQCQAWVNAHPGVRHTVGCAFFPALRQTWVSSEFLASQGDRVRSQHVLQIYVKTKQNIIFVSKNKGSLETLTHFNNELPGIQKQSLKPVHQIVMCIEQDSVITKVAIYKDEIYRIQMARKLYCVHVLCLW